MRLCCVCRPGVRLPDAEAPVHMRRQQQPPGARREDTEHLVAAAGERPAGTVRGAARDTQHATWVLKTRQFLFMTFRRRKRRLSWPFCKRGSLILLSLNEFLVAPNLPLLSNRRRHSFHILRYPRESDYRRRPFFPPLTKFRISCSNATSLSGKLFGLSVSLRRRTLSRQTVNERWADGPRKDLCCDER